MDELLEQFLIEGRELVAQAALDFDALTRDPRDRAAVDSAFRAFHTLKGSVGLFAMAPAERLLHAAEDLLERARKGQAPLDAADISALVACLDQTDRWIDEMAIAGALAPAAADIAAKLLTPLSVQAGVIQAATAADASADARTDAWADAIRLRDAAILAQSDRPLTAFRYTPDADCFFRGEDPLAVVAQAPELVSLAILPAAAAWAPASAFEPFVCTSVLEGLSAAPPEEVGLAFRLVRDQVVLTVIDPAASAEPASLPERGTSGGGALRVDVARVDALADGLGDLFVFVHGLAELADDAERIDPMLATRLRKTRSDLERLAGKLRQRIGAVRSVPLETPLRRLPRMAREIAESVGKDIAFTIVGGGIEADRQIADGLYEPLLHLLRNAIDHGIEPREQRLAAGKSATGRITLTIRRDGEVIEAALRDDGAGIDAAEVRRIAVTRGLIGAEAAAALDDMAALRLIFAPGFSTAQAVTEISGRGVGMNAVDAALATLRGSIDVESELGQGTCFRMRLPANALTTRLLVIRAGGDRYGVALDQVIETARVDQAALIPIGGGFACVLRDRTIPVLSLAALLGREPRIAAHAKLIVTQARGEPVALRVDDFGERMDTSIRAPRGLLASVPGIMGSALLSDGGVLLVLDLAELAA
jgi:two-component system chemotaxis sensor kinase CheA